MMFVVLAVGVCLRKHVLDLDLSTSEILEVTHEVTGHCIFMRIEIDFARLSVLRPKKLAG